MDGAEKLWNDLASLDQMDVEARTGIRCIEGAYEVPFLNRRLRVDPEAKSIKDRVVAGNDYQTNHLTLTLLSYLVHGEKRRPDGIWITEKELPGGSLFFQGPHGMPAESLTGRFGTNAGEFVKSGESLGGRASGFGDGSVELDVLPGVKLCIVLWEADDEFPASCTFMFDKSFQDMLALDVVLGLVQAVVSFVLSER